MFDWDLTDRDQGNIDTKMMVFLWFKDGVTRMVRKKVQLDLQQSLAEHRNMESHAGCGVCVASRPTTHNTSHLFLC